MAPLAAWAKLCDFGGSQEEVVFYDFLTGEKSADKSLKIRPGRSRGSPGDARGENADAGPVPRRGGKGEGNTK